MKQVKFGIDSTSALVQGCMRISGLSLGETEKLVETDLEVGISCFDHSDIYGGGECERIFGKVLKNQPGLRDKMVIQSKCGIMPGYYDSSKEHILESVEGILSRLQIDMLDCLLLHRPDALMEPEEVAEAFSQLEQQGKVRQFGVSNYRPSQIALLQQSVSQPLMANQLQFGVAHTGMVDSGLWVNTKASGGVDCMESPLEYARLHQMTIQAWSPFQYGMFEGVFFQNPKYKELCNTLEAVGKEHGITDSATAVAWILRHPARMQVIVGSVNPQRITQLAQGGEINLSRQQWYAIYRSAGNQLP